MAAVPTQSRVIVDGKFFRLNGAKFFVKGVAYGPFAPDAQGSPFASPERTTLDLSQIAELGANVVRVYQPPPRWFLDMALDRNLRVLVDVPWNKHLCFDTEPRRAAARETVRQAARACAHHPAVLALSVANEIAPDIVRWIGIRAVADFIDELVLEAKRIAPDCLCTYSNYPTTEFLSPRSVDFVCFNVFLHDRRRFQDYLARLQMTADSKPLVLGEFGFDSLREGEARKCGMLSWQIEDAFRGGLAGAVVFSYTDDWFRGGRLIDDWQMGLVTAGRQPKESFAAVRRLFLEAPYFPPPRHPRVSVVVATYNGERTLKACLESLRHLRYPDYEVILVDDGSTDATREIAAAFPEVRCFRHERNLGLSVARNTGIAMAQGEIVAFTDSDCRADEDWLHYLVGSLADGEFAGMGGPNLLPPDDSAVAAAVMASPGGPAHVMLTDRRAEHIPGCNMAFTKQALEEIGGFDPVFMRAGDDVDICWRTQQAGHRIGFSPAACVWHYRRSTVGAYLRQQRGYGEAEALLVGKHPENFNALGGGIWRGRIYAASKFGVEIRPPVIYHGLFASAGFQRLYASEPATILMLCTTLEYHLFAMLPLWIVSALFPWLLPVAITGLLLPIGICATAGFQAVLPRNRIHWWSRPLVALLFLLQPIVRGWARYKGRLVPPPRAVPDQESLDSIALRNSGQPLDQVQYWSERRLDRLSFVASILRRLQEKAWAHRADSGWSEHDIEISGGPWSHLQLAIVMEDHPDDRQMIRCRLRTRWPLPARTAFWSLLGLELLVVGLAGPSRPWPWCLFLTLPLLAWFLAREQRRLQSVVVILLDTLTREQGLARVGPENGQGA